MTQITERALAWPTGLVVRTFPNVFLPDFLYYSEWIPMKNRDRQLKLDGSQKMTTEQSPASFRNLNHQNRQFWAKRSRLTEQLIIDPIVYPLALHHMRLEADRLPLKDQKSIDHALVEAAEMLNTYMLVKNPTPAEKARKRHLSRKGGSAYKTDALQTLIQTCDRQLPGISQRELLHHLKTYLGQGTLRVIDNEKIEFLNYNGKLKSAPVSGLKDRLSRAKSKINSL
jgi:hypothetical protein